MACRAREMRQRTGKPHIVKVDSLWWAAPELTEGVEMLNAPTVRQLISGYAQEKTAT